MPISILPLQHRKIPKSEIHVAKRRLHKQARLKKRIFFSFLESSSSICSLPFSESVYKFLCLCFYLGPATPIFTKLLKVSMTVLRSINIKIIIYLDGMLLIGHSLEEKCMSRDIVIFHLGFIIN